MDIPVVYGHYSGRTEFDRSPHYLLHNWFGDDSTNSSIYY